MNVGQLLQKIKDLVTAFRAGQYLQAAMLAWEIVQAFLNSIPQTELGRPRPMHASYSAGFDLETATIDECVDELEKLTSNPTMASANAADPVGNPIIALLLPIVAKLVLKWLGL